MKLKDILLFGVTALSAAIVSSCSSVPYELNPEIEAYTRSFIKTFGLIDEHQDWNLAERQSVTVTMNAPGDVKIYAFIDDAYYLVGDYENVSGTKTLHFDVPEGTTRLKVAANDARVDAMVGQTVDFGTARSRTSYDIGGGSSITVTPLLDYQYNSNWLRIPAAGVLSYQNTLPEGQDNRYESFVNKNFLYKSAGPFIIHPIYWQTSQTNTLGIYYYCDSSTEGAEQVYNHADGRYVWIKRIEVYTIKGGNNVLYYANPTEDNTELTFSLNGDQYRYIKKNSTDWQLFNGYKMEDCITGDVNSENSTQFLSKGILVDIPEGMTFGMYIKLSNPSTYRDEFGNDWSGQYFYSESELNPDPFIDRTYKSDNKVNGNIKDSYKRPWQACHAASFIGEGYGALALMFEDWMDGSDSDMDLNDMVFVFFGADPERISGGIPTINPHDRITANPYQWIIAAEDLGATDDFDFNDVVVGVEYVSGQTTAQLTALAAGGTLPVKLLYNGNVVKSADGEDQFHSWFKGNPPTTTMINTTGIKYTCKGKVSINVPSDFTIATIDIDNKWSPQYGEGRMGGFSLEVERSDGKYSYIEAPGTGTAPQMICVPGGWAWPRERVNIPDAYKSFTDWVSKPVEYSTWYKSNYVVTKLIQDPNYDTGSSTGGSTGGTTVTGDDFKIEAPTVASDGVRTPAAQGPYGYSYFDVDLKLLQSDHILVQSYRYYTMMLNEDGTYNDTYKQYFINALMRHYWSEVFCTPPLDANGNSTVSVWTDQSCVYPATTFGDDKDFMLVEVLEVVPTNSTVARVLVKLQQVEAAPNSGGSQGGDEDPSTPPAQLTDLTVTELSSADVSWWGFPTHKMYRISGVSAGDTVKITVHKVSDNHFDYGPTTSLGTSAYYTSDNEILSITVTGIGDNDYFYVATYNGDSIVKAQK